MSDKTTDNTDWLDELRNIFDVGYQAGQDLVMQRQFEDVEVYDRYRERIVKSAKQAIQQHEQQAIKRELERLTDSQENTQDMERANPGYSFEVIPATLVYDRIKALSQSQEKEQS